MFYVDIFERTNAQESERLEFPFDEGTLAHTIAKHGWENPDDLAYRIFNDGGPGVYWKTSWIIDYFYEHASLTQLNMLDLIADSISNNDFYRAIFYYDQVVCDADPLSFANVMYQIQDSYVCEYEYSGMDNSRYERLGKEIAGINAECGEGIPEWAQSYIDYHEIGRDHDVDYYYDEDYYIRCDDCNIDKDEYGWAEFDDEWDWDLFAECCAEERTKFGGTYKSTTDKLLEFLEVSA